ncbi:MAG TPA: hypothetical protein VFO40_07240, partial [Chthoniobacterales bacterium]|nr:hypothetical protein [Chthoniobacterales bacterium]
LRSVATAVIDGKNYDDYARTKGTVRFWIRVLHAHELGATSVLTLGQILEASWPNHIELDTESTIALRSFSNICSSAYHDEGRLTREPTRR